MDSEACNSSPKAHWPHTHTHSARQDTVLPARDRQDTALSCWTDLEGGLGHAPLYLNLFCDSALKAKDIFIDVTITGKPLTVIQSQALSCVLIFTTTCQFLKLVLYLHVHLH